MDQNPVLRVTVYLDSSVSEARKEIAKLYSIHDKSPDANDLSKALISNCEDITVTLTNINYHA